MKQELLIRLTCARVCQCQGGPGGDDLTALPGDVDAVALIPLPPAAVLYARDLPHTRRRAAVANGSADEDRFVAVKRERSILCLKPPL